MKFLTTLKHTDSFRTMPGSVIRQLYTALADAMNQQREAGIAEVYFRPRDGSFVIIHECETFGEVAKNMFKIPAFGLFHSDTEILADFDEIINEILENMEAGDNLMPGGTVK